MSPDVLNGTEPVYASRSATKQYRTDLPAVVDHYNGFFGLRLNVRQKADLVEFLKSL